MKSSPASPRILVLTSTFPRWHGDTEPPFVFELCRRLRNHFDIHVLAPHAEGVRSETNFDGLRVTRYRYFFSRFETLTYSGGILANLKKKHYRYALIPLFLLFQVLAIRKLLWQYPFDLVHAHWLIPQGVCAVLARRMLGKTGPPLLCTSHGGDLYGLNGKPLLWLKRSVVESSHTVTVVSRTMRTELGSLGTNLNKVHVIPMGVDLQKRFVPPRNRNSAKSLLFVGRAVEKKGLRFLVEAMPEILARHPDAKLRVAGDGQELKNVKSLADNLGVAGKIEFLGAVGNEFLPELYQTSDVVVFPSIIAEGGDREGFGLVLVEALGCECAVVSTDLPATRDIIKDGETGLVVAQKDARQLSNRVNQLFSDPGLRARLGANGRRHVLRLFDWSIISNQYETLIQSVLNDDRARHPFLYNRNKRQQ